MSRSSFPLSAWVAALRAGKATYRLGELARIAGQTQSAARRATHRLVERGLLVRVGKALYANLLARDGPPTVEQLAGVLYPPAYISLDSGLYMHGIANQAPMLLTCVTTNKTKRMHTAVGEIIFHHLQPALLFGWSTSAGVPLGAPEKVVLDAIYIGRQNGRPLALDEWSWEGIDPSLLWTWAASYPRTVRTDLERVAALVRAAPRPPPP